MYAQAVIYFTTIGTLLSGSSISVTSGYRWLYGSSTLLICTKSIVNGKMSCPTCRCAATGYIRLFGLEPKLNAISSWTPYPSDDQEEGRGDPETTNAPCGLGDASSSLQFSPVFIFSTSSHCVRLIFSYIQRDNERLRFKNKELKECNRSMSKSYEMTKKTLAMEQKRRQEAIAYGHSMELLLEKEKNDLQLQLCALDRSFANERDKATKELSSASDTNSALTLRIQDLTTKVPISHRVHALFDSTLDCFHFFFDMNKFRAIALQIY